MWKKIWKCVVVLGMIAELISIVEAVLSIRKMIMDKKAAKEQTDE